jgi:hypothetical protein
MKKKSKEWSKDFRYCRICYDTKHNHVMEGYCQKCFNSMDTETIITTKKRKCLTCEESFDSQNAGHRRCDACIKKNPSARYQHRLSINQ